MENSRTLMIAKGRKEIKVLAARELKVERLNLRIVLKET